LIIHGEGYFIKIFTSVQVASVALTKSELNVFKAWLLAVSPPVKAKGCAGCQRHCEDDCNLFHCNYFLCVWLLLSEISDAGGLGQVTVAENEFLRLVSSRRTRTSRRQAGKTRPVPQ
jgi:hypothetical protein